MLTWAASAQDWKDQLDVFASVKTLQAKKGYQVLSSPAGHVVKDVSEAEPVNTKAALEYEGKLYYMSDWSWSRYQSGKEPYWILLKGQEETPEMPQPAPQAEEKEGKEEKAPGQPEAEKKPDAADNESMEKPASAPPEVKDPLAEELGKKWEGVLEVYPAPRDVPAPKGYKLLAAPDRKRKPLKSTRSETSPTVQAALTRKDGYVYYISDWSWSRVKVGKEPSWMFITDSKPRDPPPGIESRVVKEEPSDREEKAEDSAPSAASLLIDKVKQFALPKLTLDSVDASGRVVALLVGNGRYSSANRTQQMLDLEDPAANVELLGRTLRALNVEVLEKKDLNKEQLDRVIQETAAGLHRGDVFLFYYAGHALQLAGKNYLVPMDINFLDRKTVRDSAYPLDGLWKAVSERSLRFAAVCLDACRKNPFNSKDSSFYILSRIPGLSLAGDSGTKPGLASEKSPRNSLVSFAAEPGTIVPEGASGAGPSTYATALAAALSENIEFREVLNQVNRRVSESTNQRQHPWVSWGEFSQFYLHTPGRTTLDPDQAVAKAGEWLQREKDKGLPIAIGLLARSVRQRPAKNPATAGLLFLLGYQAMPVPHKSWGPFPATAEGGYSGELQLSIDARYVGLISATEDKPDLILDRENGEVVSEVPGSFAKGLGKVAISTEHIGSQPSEGAGGLSVISFQRKPSEAEAKAGGDVVHSMTPLLLKSHLVASFYDEGLERVFLALQDNEKRVTFWEYATTPPVGCREDLRIASAMPDLTKTGSVPLAAGAVPEGPGGPAYAWSLVFDAASDEIRFLRGSDQVYRREGATKPDKRLDDWRLDIPARKLVLVFRDHVDVLGFNGAVVSKLDLPAGSSVGRKVLSFNAVFRRLALAWGSAAKPEEEGRQEIAIFDLSTGQRTASPEPMVGFGEFAGLTSDQEWFLYYDPARRIRLADMVSGGSRIHLPGTATLQALPVGAGLEPKTDGDFPVYELHPPPLEGFGGSFGAPVWLADLAEALIGFRVNENSEVEWLENVPKRLESAKQQMRRRPGEEVQKSWAKWLLVNRLGAEE